MDETLIEDFEETSKKMKEFVLSHRENFDGVRFKQLPEHFGVGFYSGYGKAVLELLQIASKTGIGYTMTCDPKFAGVMFVIIYIQGVVRQNIKS